MSFIEIKDLSKQYMATSRPVLALRGSNLDVNENEICTIMGPSGCGKSTLLNILGGIDDPTSGFARVGNFVFTARAGPAYKTANPPDKVQYRRNHVGFIFQFHNLSPVHNAVENIELPMIFSGVPREVRKKKALELLTDVGLEDRAEHRPDELSGGERQRVAVATAFANSPSLILADEPTGELDEENSQMIVDLILKLKQEKQFSMILVTHNPMVARMGDNIYNMHDGAIRGTIKKSVLNSYANFSNDVNVERQSGGTTNMIFPPRFCSSCGSANLIIPSFSSKTGFWMQSLQDKRMDFEFEYAQCTKCGRIYWNVKSITNT